jgi:membrane dipeptidase
MKDVSFYPNLLEGLLELEYPVADVEKVMNGNLLRVWQANLDYAERSAKGP